MHHSTMAMFEGVDDGTMTVPSCARGACGFDSALLQSMLVSKSKMKKVLLERHSRGDYESGLATKMIGYDTTRLASLVVRDMPAPESQLVLLM